MHSEDDLSPRPTKRRRIDYEVDGLSVVREGSSASYPQNQSEFIDITSNSPSRREFSQLVENPPFSSSQTGEDGVHATPDEMIETSDNEERLYWEEVEPRYPDASSPNTHRASPEHSIHLSSPVISRDLPPTTPGVESPVGQIELPVTSTPGIVSTSSQLLPSSSPPSRHMLTPRSKQEQEERNSETESDDQPLMPITTRHNASFSAANENSSTAQGSTNTASQILPQREYIDASSSHSNDHHRNTEGLDRSQPSLRPALSKSPPQIASQPINAQPSPQSPTIASFHSPSLSPLPPSPPRRRTRERNKTFKPYTEYRLQYGDETLEKLEQEEEIRRATRPAWQNGAWGDGNIDDDEEASIPAGQSQVDEMLDGEFENILDQAERKLYLKRKSMTHGNEKQAQKSWPEVPVPTWSPLKRGVAAQRTTPPPGSAVNDDSRRRFVTLEGSPIKKKKKSKKDRTAPPSRHLDPDTALKILYADEFEGGDTGFNNAFDDDEGVPPTDPDTSRSARQSTVEDSDSDEETQHPVKKPGGRGPRRFVVDDDDEDVEMEDDQDEEDDEGEIKSDEDWIDPAQLKALRKVWPDSMIRRNFKRQKEKLEQQRRRREEERARRAARGLGDSDLSDDAEFNDLSLRPGQSRIRRIPDGSQNIPDMSRSRGHDIIDLTSDRESLDNDARDVEAIEGHLDDIISDSDVPEWMQYDERDLPVGAEAMEDNRFFYGSTSRRGGSGTGKARLPGSTRRVYGYGGGSRKRLWQTRIDKMLNSTKAAAKSKKSSHRKDVSNKTSGKDSRHPANDKARLPPNTRMITNSMGAFGPVQSRLPFEPIQGDVPETYRRSSYSQAYKGSKADSRHINASIDSRKHVAPSKNSGAFDTRLEDFFDILAPSPTHHSTGSISSNTSTHKSCPPASKLVSRAHGHTLQQYPHTQSIIGTNANDPDSNIEISLNSALAFGMRRNRQGYSVPETSCLLKGVSLISSM